MPNFNTYPRFVNLDDDLRTLEREAARYISNARGYSSSSTEARSLENIKSTVEVVFSSVSGDDFVVGSVKHEEKNDIYIFIWNSEKNHRILRYNTITDSGQVVLQNGLLGFTRTCNIQGFAITSQSPSDTLLYWSDGVTQPKKINVTRATYHTQGDYVNGYPNPLTIEMIRWIKYPPLSEPTFVHGKDPNIVYNNIAEEVFQFRYRYVHKDGERTAYSPASSLSISEYQLRNGVFQSQSTDLIYNYLDITVANSWNDVDKIEVIAKKSTSTEWVLVKTLDNDTGGLPTQSFRFYNDDVYNAVDEFEAAKSYDAVPIRCTALEYILNRAIIGNAVDGYDNIPQSELDSKVTINARYSAKQEIKETAISYSEVVNANDLTVTFITNGLTVSSGDLFSINFTALLNYTFGSFSGTFYETYSASPTDGIADVVNGLASQFLNDVNGKVKITAATNTANDLVLTLAYDLPVGAPAIGNGGLTVNNSVKIEDFEAVPSYKMGAKHPIGIQYYDFANRHGSVQKPRENSAYVEWISDRGSDIRRGKASIDLRVGVTPPVWATHWRPVYGGNKSIGKFLQYTVVAAYTNVNNVSGQGDRHIYVPLHTFKGGVDDDAHGDAYRDDTGAIPDYQFAEGDRCRIISYVPAGSSSTPLEDDRVYTTEYLDFKVIDFKYLEPDVDTNPIYSSGSKNTYGWTLILEDPNRGVNDAWSWDYINTNGAENNNWFVKNSGNDHGSSALIELYNIKDRNIEDVYYETSELFEIDAAGLPNRAHKGNRDQNDSYSILEADVNSVEGATNSVIYEVDPFQFYIGDVVNFNGGTASPAGDFTIVDIVKSTVAADTYQVYFDSALGVTTAGELGDTNLKDLYAAVTLGEGDVWLKPRKLITGTLDNNTTTQRTIFYDSVEDYYANDFFESNAWYNKGRVQAYSEYAKQEDRKASVWLSEPYFPTTNTNGLSAFNLSNADSPLKEYDRSLGSIQLLKRRGDDLIMYQENKVSLIKVGKDTLTTGDGGTLITLTSRVLSEQVPYMGDYGISMNPESWAEKDGRHYFLDIKRGKVMRLGGDGLTPISDYKISKLLDELSKEYMSIVNSSGFKAYGGFDREHDEYNLTFDEVVVSNVSFNASALTYNTPNLTDDGTDIIVSAPFSASTVPSEMVVVEGEDVFVDIVDFEQLSTLNTVFLNNETVEELPSLESLPIGVRINDQNVGATYIPSLSTVNIPQDNEGNTLSSQIVKTVTPLTITFHEDSNTWCGERSYTPNGYQNVGYTMLGFKGGEIWKHDRGTDYNTFYGVSYPTVCWVVFPQTPSVNKVFNSISTESNVPFNVTEAMTNITTTDFTKERFVKRENIWYADIARSTSTNANTNTNVYGVGEIASQNGLNLTLSTKITELGISIGDNLFNSNGTVDLGTVTAIVDDFTVALTINTSGVAGDFVYGVKSSKVEGDACRGVYLIVKLSSDSTEFVELFSANTNIDASNLTLTQV